MAKIKLTREQSLRAGHLLHMRYAVSELADEIGCKPDTIYKSLIPAGCPHEKDDAGRLWIIGTEFREWARSQTSTGRMGDGRTGRSKMAPGQAYCFRCQKRVPMSVVEVTLVNPYAEIVKGTCSECGGKVNVARKRQEEAPSDRS